MTSLAWRAAATLLIGAIHTAKAQVSPARPDTTVVPWSALTERPQLRDAAPAAGIHFPDILRSARVGGNVRLAVVVGADGQPERSNIRVISSTHDLFTIAVRNAVRQWRMSQPMLDGPSARRFPNVRDPANCPPTYESMILRVDSLGKPLGSPTGVPDPV